MKAKSHIFSEMRGTVGGITYTANQHAAIVARQYVNPVHPNSVMQNYAKTAFAGAVQKWRLSSDAIRLGWKNWTAAVGIGLDARSAFISSGSFVNYLYQRNEFPTPFTGDVPTIDGVPLLLINAIVYEGTIGQTGISFQLTNLAAIAQDYAIWNGVQVSGSRNFYDAPWLPKSLQVGSLAGLATKTITITLPDGVEGQRLFCRLVPWVNDPTPFVGQTIGAQVIFYDTLVTAE
jgi:hypothetical protein